MVHRSGAQTTGGFTTREGEQVLVTPSGEIVGTAVPVPGGGSGSPPPTPPPPEEEIIVTSGKAVRVGTSTFTGGAIVPGSGGLTANQLQAGLKRQAREEGISGRFTAIIPISRGRALQQTQTITINGKVIPQPNIPRTPRPPGEVRADIRAKVEEGFPRGELRREDFFRDVVKRGRADQILVFPTIGATFVGGVGFVSEKTGVTELLKDSPLGLTVSGQQAGRTIGELTAFGALLSPIATTAAIETSILKRTNLLFLGASQEARGGDVLTRLIFKTERGGVIETGLATGVSRRILTEGADTILITRSGGAIIESGVQFPTLKNIIKIREPFIGTDVTFIRRIGDKAFVQLSAGEVKALGIEAQRVGTVGAGFKIGELTQTAGVTRGAGGDVFFGGIVRTKASEKVLGGFRGGGSQSLKKVTFDQAALLSTQQAVAKSIAKSVAKESTSARIIPFVSIQRGTPTPVSLETITRQTPKLQTGQLEKVKTRTTQIVAIKSGQATRQLPKLRQETLQETRQQQKALQIVKQVPRQIQRTRLSLLQKSVLETPGRGFGTFSFRSITPRRKIPRIPFGFRAESTRRGRGLFKVLVRRRGEFRVVGRGRTSREAVGIGRRVARQTLARTFFVPGLKPRRVRGFRTSQEKIGQVFIQRTKSPFGSTLGTRGELTEIQTARQRRRR